MKIVSPLLKSVVYPGLAATGVFRKTSQSGLAVVTYHGVVPAGYQSQDPVFDGNLIDAETLRSQLRLLKARYSVISPQNALAWRRGSFELPRRAVLITCDDGLLNCLTDMLPVLDEELVKCLFFVTGASTEDARASLWYEDLFLLLSRAPTGQFEISDAGVEFRGELGSRQQRRTTWWDLVKRLSQLDSARRASFLRMLKAKLGVSLDHDFSDTISSRRFGLLTRSELLRLAAAGMTIGGHTLSHPMLSQMPAELSYGEVSESRAKLESVLQQAVWAFAYPFGDSQSVTPEVLAMPQKAAYEAAFVNFGGGLGTDLPPYALPRIHVTAEMGLSEFEAHVSGFYARLQRKAGRAPQTFGMMQAAK
jgi:peptidoglycan/xylan/chitin deacetylase (PgdA/CDA1 family)